MAHADEQLPRPQQDRLEQQLGRLLAELEQRDDIEALKARLLEFWRSLQSRTCAQTQPRGRRRNAIAVFVSVAFSLTAIVTGLVLLRTPTTRAPIPPIARPDDRPQPAPLVHRPPASIDAPQRTMASSLPARTPQNTGPASRPAGIADLFLVQIAPPTVRNRLPSDALQDPGEPGEPVADASPAAVRAWLRRTGGRAGLRSALQRFVATAADEGTCREVVQAVAELVPDRVLSGLLLEQPAAADAPLLAAALLHKGSLAAAGRVLQWWRSKQVRNEQRDAAVRWCPKATLRPLLHLTAQPRNSRAALEILCRLARDERYANDLLELAKRDPRRLRLVIACLTAAGQAKLVQVAARRDPRIRAWLQL